MVGPKHVKPRPFDRSKDQVGFRFPSEVKAYLLGHGVDLSKECRDRLMEIYTDLVQKHGPKVPKGPK
jgi:hypothetical protein